MNNEDYVSFEQAKKLKELGFDWECKASYHDLSGFKESVYAHNFNRSKRYSDCICSAPTLAQIQKWLREVKELDIDITLFRDIDATGDKPIIKRYYNCEIAFDEDEEDLYEDFDTYEHALSAGIDKALEILKQKDNE